MKMRSILILFMVLLNMPAWAAMQTVTLSVPGMTCAACPITLKVALKKIKGVSQVDASYSEREAVVTFDDNQTSVEALIEATGNIGYTSTLKLPESDQ